MSAEITEKSHEKSQTAYQISDPTFQSKTHKIQIRSPILYIYYLFIY